MNLSARQIVALLGFIGVVAGSFMPWAQVGIAHVNGTDGDGVITLILGLIGAVAIVAASESSFLVSGCILLGLAALGIAVYDISNVSKVASQVDFLGSTIDFSARVGTGLWLVALAGGLASVGSLLVATEPGSERAVYKTCPTCGHVLFDGERFCVNCGHDWDLETQSRYGTCPNCEYQVLDGERFCAKCGEELEVRRLLRRRYGRID